MSKKKNTLDFLPQPKEGKEQIIVRIPKSFYDKVNEQRQKDQLKWIELMTACLNRYLTERSP